MNKYLKTFLHRGLIFSGLGPMVLGIVYFILSLTVDGFSLSGSEVLLGIVSTYLLAFVQSGGSVFNQIEEWPIMKSLFFHLGSLYVAYSICYLVNSWIPFNAVAFLMFTAIFIACYFIVWLTVYFSVKATEKILNANLK